MCQNHRREIYLQEVSILFPDTHTHTHSNSYDVCLDIRLVAAWLPTLDLILDTEDLAPQPPLVCIWA
jgi:hypothetical protein